MTERKPTARIAAFKGSGWIRSARSWSPSGPRRRSSSLCWWCTPPPIPPGRCSTGVRWRPWPRSPCATTFAQWGGITAYRGDQGCVAEMAREFDRRRRMVVNAMQQMPGVRLAVPRGAFYVFPDFSAFGLPDMELAEYLLREAHLAAVPGSEFGEPGPACASPTPPSTRPSPTAWRGWPRPWQRCQVAAPSRLLKKAHLG